jgi:hypothetical protein
MPGFFKTRDVQAGLLYLVIGFAALIVGRRYAMGTIDDMGSGYFPFLLSVLLMAIGLASVLCGALQGGEAAEPPHWRTLALITAAILLFGLATPMLGAVITLPALTFACMAASKTFALNRATLLFVAALTTFCLLVFLKGLGLSIPIKGWLFGG